MPILDILLLGNPLAIWLLALGITGLCLLVLKGFQKLVLHRLSRFAARAETQLDDLILAVLNSTRFHSALMVGIFLGAKVLETSPAVDHSLRLALSLVLLLQGALWAGSAIAFSLALAVERRKAEDAGGVTALMAMGLVAKVLLWTLVLLLALAVLGVNVTGLVAGLGVGGIAVALAVQNVLGDLFASLSIVLDKPFAVGDFITVGESAGTVQHIGLKTTRVRSLSGEQIIFSNSDLLKSRIRNHKRMEERRVAFSLGVTLETCPAKLEALPAQLRALIEAQDQVRFDRAHFKEIGLSSFIFEMVYYLLDPDMGLYMDTQQALNLEIIRLLEAQGVSLAYPTQTFHHRLPAPMAASSMSLS